MRLKSPEDTFKNYNKLNIFNIILAVFLLMIDVLFFDTICSPPLWASPYRVEVIPRVFMWATEFYVLILTALVSSFPILFISLWTWRSFKAPGKLRPFTLNIIGMNLSVFTFFVGIWQLIILMLPFMVQIGVVSFILCVIIAFTVFMLLFSSLWYWEEMKPEVKTRVKL